MKSPAVFKKRKNVIISISTNTFIVKKINVHKKKLKIIFQKRRINHLLIILNKEVRV
jgi:hypothetical protein